ncbi:MAG TPA: right-handed parallel beta-helix repeat-containing protein [Thermoanaerobaculia bacterium]|nr:right-handed parallel beta-helix repeat-containing protein [Thermoanaerobaculia bacterium]
MTVARSFAVLSLFVFLAVSPAAAQNIVRVAPGGDLQKAIGQVKDGGVIEMAGGVYASPPRGWDLSNKGKAFTIRAAAGAEVVLDGGRSRRILRFKNGARARGKLITFERLVFRNGSSNTPGEAGGVSIAQAQALFRNCRFEDNAPSITDYGAVRVADNSEVTFLRCQFRGNQSRNRGGALAIEFSNVTVQGSTFVDNRVNLPGHHPGSAGGAIYVLDSTLNVINSNFEGNEAGWVGGAIYAIGVWATPVTTPRVNVSVRSSTFLENRADAHACCPALGPTTGGALHAEDQATLSIQRSRFLENEAQHGGAVSNYRAVVDIQGSVFQGNLATLTEGTSAGGAVNVMSNDASDASTGNGAINRRPARLTVTDTFFQGRFGSTGVAAHTGGCLLAGGDANRLFGAGVPQSGTAADNRAVVTLQRTVFFDCDVERSPQGQGGFGGAIQVDLAALTLEDSMVLRSDAFGDPSGGGGLAISRDSDVRVSRATFAYNTARERGGAIDLGGSAAQISASRFFGNEVSPGISEAINQSLGAAIYAIPFLSNQDRSRARPVSGVVSGSLFVDNGGLPLFDVEPESGPANDVRYDGNDIQPSRFGDKVYINSLADPGRGGSNVAQLNDLVVNRGSRGTFRKSQAANRSLSSAPSTGSLVAAPTILPAGATTAPANAFLAYAWSGRSATLEGQPLTAKSGVIEVANPGTYRLAVDGTVVATVTVSRVAWRQ